jgi:outer membrane protein OmpA-like peptidoglycan-associated protein
MRRNILITTCAFLIVLIFAAPAPADLIVMKNGDKLFGKIQNRQFAVKSPYGQIICSYDFLKMISFDERKTASGLMRTINNDHFSGSILVNEFEIILEDGEHRSISSQQIKKVRIETHGPSYKITTAIISMQNGDRFSGSVITEDFKVKSGYMVKHIQRSTVNRIEMPFSGQDQVKLRLNNGDLISGQLLAEQFEVHADAIGPLTVGKSAISSIQFNASKMVLSQISFSGERSVTGGKSFDSDQSSAAHQSVMDDTRRNSKIKTIFFDFDKYDLHHEFYADLDNVVSVLIKDPAVKIQIQGHTDNIGTPEYNMNLSEKRAGEVKGYLVSKGIDTIRISTIGYGYTQNEASNDTISGRAQNRRAEIVLLE